MKVLIFGLPGSGKTTLADYLADLLGDRAVRINADAVRKECDDWDFSIKGRERQLQRMRILAEKASNKGKIAITDFICPLEEYRELFDADFTVFVDTVTECEYEDTNTIFQRPDVYELGTIDYQVTNHRDDYDAREIMWELLDKDFDVRKPTAQVLGRFQPWHNGHQALFDRALEKEGQVAIMVRDSEQNDDNPFHVLDVCQHLRLHLAEYAGKVRIFAAPNITRISYGRDVGYEIEQEHFDKAIEDISATKIREVMQQIKD